MKKKNVTTNKYDTVACEDIYSVACNKAIMGKNSLQASEVPLKKAD